MAISMCVAVPGNVSAYSSFSRKKNKEHQIYPTSNVALTRSSRVSSAISLPQAKGSHVAFEILRTISEKGDEEVQEELDRLQNAFEKLKRLFGDIILVLVAINPILRLLCDAMVLKNCSLRRCSFGASYGALLVFNGIVKILWSSQPIWSYNICLGFLIYKAHMLNIALHKKGRGPFWLGPLLVLAFGKLTADLLSFTSMPVNIIWASMEIVVSALMVPFILGLI